MYENLDKCCKMSTKYLLEEIDLDTAENEASEGS